MAQQVATSTRYYFVAINAYRSSTDNGFGNTWRVRRCYSAKQQRAVLTKGLPVSDAEFIDSDGQRSPVFSTMGIRAATPAERREAHRDMRYNGKDSIQTVEYHIGED